MGLDVPVEHEDTEVAVKEQRKYFEAYAKGIYEMREQEQLLKLYEQLSEENRAKVRMYIERLLVIQRIEDEFRGDYEF